MSIAEAHFEPKAWFRAIYAGEDPVGFVMLYDDPEKPEYYLWRLMIAGEHQRKGYGREALRLLVEHVRARPGARELLDLRRAGRRRPAARSTRASGSSPPAKWTTARKYCGLPWTEPGRPAERSHPAL